MTAGRREPFGSLPDGHAVERFTLRSRELTARVLTLGGILQSVVVDGVDVLLGCSTVEAYLAGDAYLGAVVGRYANRIGGGRFALDGREHRLSVNEPPNSLHGGADGFDRRLWSVVAADDASVELALESPDGDQGYPGTLEARVRYRVAGAELRIDYRARTDAPTVVNLTSHAYWNLAGSGTIDDHVLRLDADAYLPADAASVPTGAVEDVRGTACDFATRPRALAGVYDHAFVLRGGAPAARLADPASGRTLELSTDRPSLQLYTGDRLTGSHPPRSGVALEAQAFPDAPNHPQFPSTVLRPGEELRSTTRLRFTRGAPAPRR
jgi:aldose 1-epimerase